MIWHVDTFQHLSVTDFYTLCLHLNSTYETKMCKKCHELYILRQKDKKGGYFLLLELQGEKAHFILVISAMLYLLKVVFTSLIYYRERKFCIGHFGTKKCITFIMRLHVIMIIFSLFCLTYILYIITRCAKQISRCNVCN